MNRSIPLHTLSAEELHKAFVEGEYSAVAITSHFLGRIISLDKALGSFLQITCDRALAKAEELDAMRAAKMPLGPLAGVPIAVKDNIHIYGERTTCASRMLENYVAPFSATAIERIEAAGGIIIGKTNLDEFAMGSSSEHSAYGLTRNPWDRTLSPGGSSGGSAVAVAARLAPLSLGTETGGSVRQPAAFCGITGFKPTYGRVSRYGLVAFGSSLDQIGPFATNARDAALLFETIAGHCARDSTSIREAAPRILNALNTPIRDLRIGVPWKQLDQLPADSFNHFEGALELFKSLGAKLVEVDLSLAQHAVAIYYILSSAEASTNLARFDGIRYGLRAKEATTLDEVYTLSKKEGFGSEVKRRLLFGTFVLSSGYQEAFYTQAQKVRSLLIDQYRAAFSHCSLIATPTSPQGAFRVGGMRNPLSEYLQDIYTIPASLTGMPAASTPSGFDAEGRPLGLQLIGPLNADALVLQAAHQFEELLQWRQIPPGYEMEAIDG